MSYPVLALIHIGSAITAILAGAFVVLRVKGTLTHRRIGLAYACAMITLNVSSLFIFNLTGKVSPFHAMAIFSLVTVLAGYGAALLRRPRGGWLEWHLQFMVWSYIGLLAAATAEAAVRLPKAPFWSSVAGASFAVLAAGGILFARRLPMLRSPVCTTRKRPSPMTADVRPVTEQEIPALLPLVEEYWRFEDIADFDATRVARELGRVCAEPRLGSAWIAYVHGAAIGYLLAVYVFSLEHLGLTAEIDEFFVLPSARSKGLGDRLLRVAEAEFLRRGCTNVALQLGRGNDRARVFYRAQGYSERAGFELLDKMLADRRES